MVKIVPGSQFDPALINYKDDIPKCQDFLIARFICQNKPKHKFMYICKYKICTEMFGNIYKLFNHLRAHANEKPFVCRQCDRAFSLLGNRNKHESQIHNSQVVLTCEICSETFRKKQGFKKHVDACQIFKRLNLIK